MKQKLKTTYPSAAVVEAELKHLEEQAQYRMLIKSTVCILVTFAATVFLLATLWLPIVQIYGNSMEPTLSSGDILLCVKTKNLEQGDIITFYHNNKILVKRIIGCPGDEITLDEQGNVSRNGILLSETYIDMPSGGTMDITLPCQVPAGCYFVMGDHRATSIDSRSAAIGFIPEDRIFGKVLLRVWPLQRFGPMIRKGG